jgi:hypothetical protein
MRRLHKMLIAAAALSGVGGAASAQVSYIEQVGTGNRATVVQTNVDANAPLGNRIVQNGDDYKANVTQDGPGNTYSINQSGAGAHETTLSQTGGRDNSADIVQSGDTANLATVLQMGTGNRAIVNQQSYGVGANTLGIGQAGLDNTVDARQQGGGNSATFTQNGDGNYAYTSQNGQDNLLAATQTGNNNMLNFTQTGDGLKAPNISQDGGGSMTVTQTTNPF